MPNKPTEPQKSANIGVVRPREITQEMKESYIDYAMSVIVARALPDVRDGLKPVHRRILYTMLEEGLRHSSKFRKSATVVGSTLGRYHPHGDMAVYDSLVRMAQDFSLRYPLIQGQGNFGSIDNDPPAAQRYCVTGDSLVITSQCLEKIAEVSDKEDISLKVLSFNGKINQASKLFDSGVHPIIQVETSHGYSIKGSSNHPILTFKKDDKNDPIFSWKPLKDIKIGDFAIIDRNDKALWPAKEPLLRTFYPEIKDRHFKIYRLPSKMTPDLAFILGAIVSEGYISINRKRKYGKIGFCNTNKNFIKEFKSKFQKVFPKCPIYELKREPLSYGKKNFISLEICSLYIIDFLKNLGLSEDFAAEKRIPQIIYHSTKKSVGQFLRSYFEGDGGIYSYVNKNKKKSSYWISCSSASKELLRGIQIYLLRFGIVSAFKQDKKRGDYRLYISGLKNLSIFKKDIGFATKEKIKKLENIFKLNQTGKALSKTDYIPFISDYLKNKYRQKKIKWIYKEWILKHNIDRYSKLKANYQNLKKILEQSDLKIIDNFIKNNYFFDKIIIKKNGGEEKVYSFRVDSACHSFVSNGFISHNTECRLSKIGEEMLRDIEKNTVDFTENYDGTRKEPIVLPSPVPQLLLNGSLGIAVGMATNIPTHNLSEVTDALIYLIDNPKTETEELFKFIQGPDFPTGGIIFDQKSIIQAYIQGKGPIVTRGKAEVQEQEKTGKQRIIISEIPFQVQKSALIEQFADLVQEKKIDGIKDIRDESDKDGMRIVIELSRDAFPQKVLNRLYKFTDLQKTFHLNMLALVDGIQPQILNLAEMLNYFLSHRKEVVTKRIKYDLEKAKERAHILEGLHKCLAHIDEVIRVIKNSQSREDAEKNLIQRFKLTKIQANAILETKLAALAKLERQKIEDELKALQTKIKELAAILQSPQKIKEVIKKELKELKENFGDQRRTKVHVSGLSEIAEEDLVPQEETIITLTQGGYIKRINPKTYKIQKRGGKGILGMKTLQDDTVEHFISANTHDALMFFTDSGKVFRTPVYEIPEGQRVARGRGLLNFLEISQQEKVLSIFSIGKQDIDLGIKYLVMVTKDGIIKKTALKEFENVRKSGLIAITLKKGDALKKVCKSTGQDEIILVTKKGISIRFPEKQAREMGRPASGVKGIRLKKGDEIIGMDIVQKLAPEDKTDKNKKAQSYLLVLTENGYGKRTDLKEYRSQGRGGSGVKTANITPKTGNLIASFVLADQEEDLIVISQKGQIIRTMISQIAKLSRPTQGVRIMRLTEGDKVASAACV